MKKMTLKELKERSGKAEQKLKSGGKLPEHDFSSLPQWDMLIHEVIAKMLGYRLRNRITQEELARRMGVKQSVISRYEHVGRNPSIEFLYKVAQGLGLQLFITPYGDRTAVLTPEQKAILEKYTTEDKPNYETVLHHIIFEYDSRNSWKLTLPFPDNEDEPVEIEIKAKKQQDYSPVSIAALSYS